MCWVRTMRKNCCVERMVEILTVICLSVYVLMVVWTRPVFLYQTVTQYITFCLCHSPCDQCTFTTNKASWSPWQTLTGHKTGFGFTRRLYMDSSSECLVEEYDSQFVVNIISEYQLPDSIFSASSTYPSTPSVPHAPYRARIDNYFTSPSSWVSGSTGTSGWLQIQLQQSYSVGGMLIRKRSDLFVQYPTAVTVKTAKGDLQWQNVILNQNLQYKDDDAILWFPMLYTTPVWRVYINAYHSYPSMKCDLRGFQNNWVGLNEQHNTIL